jgi:type IV pilus assembly protein PilY1
MKSVSRYAAVVLAVILFAWNGLVRNACSDCGDGIAVPPFLTAGGVKPNLLLMLDNSASMYDLAYVSADETYCYDDTYVPSGSYTGYFERDTIYVYSFADGEFQPNPAASSITDICTNDTASKYRGEDLCIYFDGPDQEAVTTFAARGNLLNWATTSKFDTEKKILTGGKYDDVNQRLVMESRGCLDRQFVKKVPIANSVGSAYATLGVRRDAPSYRTVIDVYSVTEDGFDVTACQEAINELESGNLGQAKLKIDECMTYFEHTGQDPLAAYKAAFNHAVQGCWFMNKQGEPIPGAGDVQRARNDCTNVYGDLRDDDATWSGPATIYFDNAAHVCSGDFATGEGYVGRCWDPSRAVYRSNGNWSTAGWIVDSSVCIEQALLDYCNAMAVPEVPDPSDVAGTTGEFWNIPAMLIDAGVLTQLLDPVTTLNGYISQLTAPTGLLQEYGDRIRIGTMVFNDFGSATECVASDPHIDYYCSDAADQDGGKVVAGIGAVTNEDLVDAVNGIQATTWTPFAEAFYNAIGYYTQNSSLRLNATDFTIGADPIEAWCQANNVVLITDGASTADMNAEVSSFVNMAGHDDEDGGDVVGCDELSGSTLLDDLTYYAKHGTDLFSAQLNGHDKENITTYVIAAGSAREGLAGECSPDTLLQAAAENGGTTFYRAENFTDLGGVLEGVFDDIASNPASGSAASVVSASRGGEGVLYQAIFWSSREDGTNSVQWTGEVRALLVNRYGEIFEDSNGNKALDAADLRVLFYYDEGFKETRACYGSLREDGSCDGLSKSTTQVRYLWAASDWLHGADVPSNRLPYISPDRERYIFTWDDLDNDGIVDSSEVLPFEPRDWGSLSVDASRGPAPLDFGLQTSDEVNEVVRWIRGEDQAGMRSRSLMLDLDRDGVLETPVTWRLGDVVYSTPMEVAAPAELYGMQYQDESYDDFYTFYRKRRRMVYFGANDGMLHAANGGFYNEESRRFCRTPDCPAEESGPELGAEMWAYVPYNLLPHLKCLTDPAYRHKYYVDLRPRIFDVQIFSPSDGTHIGGWGTILVGGMRFGGYSIRPGELDLDDNGTADYPEDSREFTSAYFILDITDPERPPVLLGELTWTTGGSEAELGYTTGIPTVVPMKDGAVTTWYLILGSGPTTLEGVSDQRANLCVLPLEWLVGSSRSALRIPNALPDPVTQGGCFQLSDDRSFVSDLATLDFEVAEEEDYKADAVYFGTVEGTFDAWGGKLYRLVTHKEDADGNQLVTVPNEWSTLLSASGKANPVPLIDAGRPITAAVNAGIDDRENFWIYVGTGRYFAGDDKTDYSQQVYYGIKEPRDASGLFTWETVGETGTRSTTPGAQGLLRVDQIQVSEGLTPEAAVLSCAGRSLCLPAGVTNFAGLKDYIVGTGDGDDVTDTGTDGWYRVFTETGERNLGQGTLFGGLITFTSYEPVNDPCLAAGESYLYGVYYQTGTAWYEPIFFPHGVGEDGLVAYKLDLGFGMFTTPTLHSGGEDGAKAYVQSSTGNIIEIDQQNLPLNNIHSERISWHELYE